VVDFLYFVIKLKNPKKHHQKKFQIKKKKSSHFDEVMKSPRYLKNLGRFLTFFF